MFRWPLVSAAFLATVAMLVAYAVGGFATLSDGRGDNDSMMRLVEVRDLLGGQGWFDLQQYRLGLEGGIGMHWSRLVDAPIALLILAADGMGLTVSQAEAFAAVSWPLILFFGAMVALLQITVRTAGAKAILPATVIATVTLYYIGIFAPGAIDHHNAQLTLTLAMIAGLVSGNSRFWPNLGAGACAAAMLAIGMETAPYVAIGGLCASLLFLFRGSGERITAIGFGIGFGASSAAAFLLTVPLTSWLRPACDAFSVAQASLAVVAGFGLAGLAWFRATSSGQTVRAAGLAVLGACVGALLVFAFPECLGDPYAMVDPWLRENWLDEIAEAQSLLDVARDKPSQLLVYYGYGLLALAVLVVRWMRKDLRRADVVVFAMLATAMVISIWQIRGSLFLLPLSAIPLAGWVAHARHLAHTQASTGTTLRMASAWILSFVVTWILFGAGVSTALAALRGEETPAISPNTSDACYREEDYAILAKEPAITVLAFTNLGSAILRNTPHSAIAGPYHRNTAGNLLALQALVAPSEEARAKIASSQATILAWCPGNAEARHLGEMSASGLAAALNRGEPPAWLTPIAVPPGSDLILYRIQR